ncbi:MAG TPA: Hsp20/alpha crystallin family protein [Candidatus Limnocylindria bacterium]|nr:Hsp20/alpha crystallin family protein [Candidatus Limnocylindria bacterium]
MAMLTRWNPVGEVLSLKQAMDRLFEDSFVSPTGWTTLSNGQAMPLVDVYELGDEVVVTAAMPGIRQEDVEVTLSGQTLTLKGEFKADENVTRDQIVYQERRYGAFHRQIPLPVRVDGDNVEATYEQGILTLRIPKAAEVRPRHIEIKPAAKQLT